MQQKHTNCRVHLDKRMEEWGLPFCK
jgi:hypothetical protein